MRLAWHRELQTVHAKMVPGQGVELGWLASDRVCSKMKRGTDIWVQFVLYKCFPAPLNGVEMDEKDRN